MKRYNIFVMLNLLFLLPVNIVYGDYYDSIYSISERVVEGPNEKTVFIQRNFKWVDDNRRIHNFQVEISGNVNFGFIGGLTTFAFTKSYSNLNFNVKMDGTQVLRQSYALSYKVGDKKNTYNETYSISNYPVSVNTRLELTGGCEPDCDHLMINILFSKR